MDPVQVDISGAKKDGELLQLVSFNIESEQFCVDIIKVQEINRMI